MTARMMGLFGTLCCLAAPAAQAADSATADMLGTDGRSVGRATLTEARPGVLIRIELQGLPPGFKAVHIHAVGTCADHAHGFVAAKAHLNPRARKHGLLNSGGPEAGDLPNIHVGADGKAMAEMHTTAVSLRDRKRRANILDEDGSALVVHAGPDDHMSQPIGGAGARIACGVIKAGP